MLTQTANVSLTLAASLNLALFVEQAKKSLHHGILAHKNYLLSSFHWLLSSKPV